MAVQKNIKPICKSRLDLQLETKTVGTMDLQLGQKKGSMGELHFNDGLASVQQKTIGPTCESLLDLQL